MSDFKSFDKGIVVLNINTKNEKGNSWWQLLLCGYGKAKDVTGNNIGMDSIQAKGLDFICFIAYMYVLSFRCYVLFDSATTRTAARQAPPSMDVSRQDYWSKLPFPSPGHLPDPEMELTSPAPTCGFFITEPPGKPWWAVCHLCLICRSKWEI